MQRTSCCIHPSLVEYRSILFEEYDGTALMIALDELPFREQRGTFVGDIDARADHEGHAATQPAGRDRRHVDLAAGDADRTLGERGTSTKLPASRSTSTSTGPRLMPVHAASSSSRTNASKAHLGSLAFRMMADLTPSRSTIQNSVAFASMSKERKYPRGALGPSRAGTSFAASWRLGIRRRVWDGAAAGVQQTGLPSACRLRAVIVFAVGFRQKAVAGRYSVGRPAALPVQCLTARLGTVRRRSKYRTVERELAAVRSRHLFHGPWNRNPKANPLPLRQSILALRPKSHGSTVGVRSDIGLWTCSRAGRMVARARHDFER